MEQAIGDQCLHKSLVSGAQWREHAVISQVVAHVLPLRQKVVETVSRLQHGWKNCLQSDSQRSRSVGSPVTPSASLYDRSGKMIFKAECSPACLTAVLSVSCAMGGRHTWWAASPLLWTPWACSEVAFLLASCSKVRKYNCWAALLCTMSTCLPHVNSEVMVMPSSLVEWMRSMSFLWMVMLGMDDGLWE